VNHRSLWKGRLDCDLIKKHQMAPVLHGRRCIQAPADLCVFGDLQPERRFYAHRLLLMCISPYFEKVFRYRAVSGGPVAGCAFCTPPATKDDSNSPKSSCTPQTTGDQQKQDLQRASKRNLHLLELTSTSDISKLSCSLENKENNSKLPTLSSKTTNDIASESALPNQDAVTTIANVITVSGPSSEPSNVSTGQMCESRELSTISLNTSSTSSDPTTKGRLVQVCDCISDTSTSKKKHRSSSISNSDSMACKKTFETLLSSFVQKMDDNTQWFDALQPFLSSPSPDQPLEQLKLSGLDGDQVEALLQFAYDGHVELSANNVQALCFAADMYSVQALFDQCQQYLYDSLCVQNCIGIFVFAHKMQSAYLETAAERYILRHFELVSSRSTEFARLLCLEQMQKLLIQHRLYVPDEHMVFLAIVRWIQFEHETRLNCFKELFQCVRLALVSDQNLVESVIPHSLMNGQSQLIHLVQRVIRCKSQLQLFERPDELLLQDLEMQTHLTPRFPLGNFSSNFKLVNFFII
jgi:hypothetical protein